MDHRVMFCGIANLVTVVAGVYFSSGLVISLNGLGSANLLSLVGCRMLFRIKELSEVSNDDGLIFTEYNQSTMPQFRIHSVPALSTALSQRFVILHSQLVPSNLERRLSIAS